MTETLGDWQVPGTGPTRQRADLARRDTLRRDLSRLYEEVTRIEDQIESADSLGLPERLVLIYNIMAGLSAGFAGATCSLLFNIIGSLLSGNHPLEFIRVCLTFPMGLRALHLETGFALAFGTCLYLLVGSLLGVAFHAVLSSVFAQAPGIWRLLAVTSMGLTIWIVIYYLILGWLQLLLTGVPRVTELWPAWLAALTHVVYSWTVLLFERRVRYPQTVGPVPGREEDDAA